MKLYAVAHDGYYSMYSYITQRSARKSLADLDQEVYLSPNHPRGLALKKLLEAGAVAARALATRKQRSDSAGASSAKRFKRGDVFQLVVASGVRTALEVQAMAASKSDKGDARLAEFCTSCGEDKLAELVHSAVGVIEAPKMLAMKMSTRMDLLRRAASEAECTCQGVWSQGARAVLCHQGESISRFCQDVCRALEFGACRGFNIAVIGDPGCGKSMLFEPFDAIYAVVGKPEAKSTFPLANVLTSHLLIWNEWKHKDSIVLFEDLLALLAGERMEIRVPHQSNKSHRNTAPMIFTSNPPLAVVREDPVAMARVNKAMAERFCTRTWTNPIPEHERNPHFPKCPRCCAAFYLMSR